MSQEHFDLNLCSSPSIFSKCVLKKHAAPERSVLQAKSLSLCVCLCVNVHQLLSWDVAGCLSTEASPRNKMCFQSLQKEPLHDRGEEVNELPFVFHLTLKMLSQCVPRPWLEWAGRAYIFTTFALRLFFLAAVRWICSKRQTKTVKWKK